MRIGAEGARPVLTRQAEVRFLYPQFLKKSVYGADDREWSSGQSPGSGSLVLAHWP